MQLTNISLKTIKQLRLKKIHNWYNNPEISKYFKSKTRTMKKIKEILSRKIPKTNNYMVNQNNKDIGYIFITKKGNYCYLTIIIDKKYWNKGYGKQAMILIEDEARKLKVKKIVLGLYAENKRALNLYKSLNYVCTKKEKNITVMEKKL
jgi:RimJ/RimL family protein N-acetyltransferase